jgi:hypothetical protein
MASGSSLLAQKSARILIAGYPGSAKTGSISALLNAGLKVRYLGFDKKANIASLLEYTKPERLANLDALFFEDPLVLEESKGYIGTAGGVPQAMILAGKAMDRWRYKEGEQEVDLGRSRDWGRDTVVVLDSLTAMGNASMRKAMAMKNKTPFTVTEGVWGFAMAEQDAFVEKLCGNANAFHLVITAHLKMQGPREVRKEDDDITKANKEAEADLIPTRLYPCALGQQLSPIIARHVPTVLMAETVFGRDGKQKHVLNTANVQHFDTKVAARGLPNQLPIDTGLLTVLEAVAGPVAHMIEGEKG